jgi:polyphosphate glucokinase
VGSATNLDPDGVLGWEGFDLAGALAMKCAGEVACANDADLAALGACRGVGRELTVTLGTGVGTGITVDGVLQPHRELCELPISTSPSLDAHVGEPIRKMLDADVWDARVVEVLELLDEEVGPDQIWLAGGNARRLTRSKLGRLEEKIWVLAEPVGLLGAQRLISS